ncbi:MAG: Polyribonucleotide nucleotidyltransferase [Candidatus Shapirobacteria bacterium GW2011_GWE2_38_30]|uniref:polyribonucleotide nucleotidyltransferase n=1 Tax=Candidatus Shapirobacteria bacterium GW2011_GWE2_38_30 TaxID=1618490 RepID=A0A0G0JLH8_9BACT|nr:MAG: Polyribonucleotide nucleotidyltransferase [Candidatus Shapirobacteria bacterium GW2011_GWE2_38_30]
MNKIIRQDIKIGNSVITLETGKLAPQANASVVATLGKTVVLATVMMGKLDETKDYFPLQVEFVDKLYAGGQVKGGKWVKRELNPSDISILFGRIIDRSIRPLFPKGFQNEVQLIVTILSNDRVNDVIIPAFLAASTALTISDIPFNAPVSAVRIGQLDDKLIINPTLEDLKTSQLDLLVCTGTAGVNMIECGANIVKNEIVLDAIELAKKTGDDINDQILKFTKTIANSKVEFTPVLPSKELLAEIESKIKTDISKFLKNGQDGSLFPNKL